jgi:LysR family transcriptional regulator of abg operon
MTDLRQIEHFEAVYRLRSFSRAADEVNLTHAALTKSIKSLEGRWDVKLFHRTTRSVTPTAAGQRLYKMVPAFLAHATRVRLSVNDDERAIHIVCGPVVLDMLVHPALLKLRETDRHVRVSAESKPPLLALEDIVQRRADIMLAHGRAMQGLPHQSQIDVTQIVDEPYFVMARADHDVLGGARRIEDIVRYDWAIAGFDNFFVQSMPSDLSALLEAHHFPKYRLLSQAACLDMVRQSDVLTAVPERVAKPLIDNSDYAGFEFPGDFRFEVSVATLSENRQDASLDALISSLDPKR